VFALVCWVMIINGDSGCRWWQPTGGLTALVGWFGVVGLLCSESACIVWTEWTLTMAFVAVCFCCCWWNVGDVDCLGLWQFTADEGEKFMKVCAVFCEDQSRALEMLRNKLRVNKDQRLSQIVKVNTSQLPLLVCPLTAVYKIWSKYVNCA